MAGTDSITCGHCGKGVAAVVVTSGTQRGGNAHPHVAWLLCPSCQDGSVRTSSGAVYPPAPAGITVRGLPVDVEHAWREARTAHAVAAYTAAEVMCRKILMHLAVDKTGSDAGKSFAQYVNDLESAGYVTPGMKPVVDSVRTRGNVANHDLPASTEQESLSTLTITQYLLQGIYELPGMAP